MVAQVKKTAKKLKKSNLPEEMLRKGGPGRPKGQPNKCNIQIVDRILGALDTLDAESMKNNNVPYLVLVGQTNPKAFMSILGRVVPKDVKISGEVQLSWAKLLGSDTD